jgi:tRNA-dihydrouridine synthase A
MNIVNAYIPYAKTQLKNGVPQSFLIKPLMGLFHGVPGAKAFRRRLCEEGLE